MVATGMGRVLPKPSLVSMCLDLVHMHRVVSSECSKDAGNGAPKVSMPTSWLHALQNGIGSIVYHFIVSVDVGGPC